MVLYKLPQEPNQGLGPVPFIIGPRLHICAFSYRPSLEPSIIHKTVPWVGPKRQQLSNRKGTYTLSRNFTRVENSIAWDVLPQEIMGILPIISVSNPPSDMERHQKPDQCTWMYPWEHCVWKNPEKLFLAMIATLSPNFMILSLLPVSSCFSSTYILGCVAKIHSQGER